MEKQFTIKKDERAFFRAYIELIRPFLKKIRSREADVFAELLYQHYLRKDIKNKYDRFRLVLGNDSRRVMEKQLDISEAVFRNALSGLRQRELLSDDNTIPDVYIVTPDDKNFKLIFNFIIEN